MQAYPVLGAMPTMGLWNPTQQVTVANSGPTLRRVQLPSSWADQCRRRRVDAGPRGRSEAWLGSGHGSQGMEAEALMGADGPAVLYRLGSDNPPSELGVSEGADGGWREPQDPDAAAFPGRRRGRRGPLRPQEVA